MWFVWYPQPLFRAIGGLELFLVLLVVDVCLGPLLTFVVYAPSKPSLKFDVAVIVVVQIAALSYGVWTLFAGRPVYVAALGHRFDVIQASEVAQPDLDAAKQSLPLWGPKWVGIKPSDDPKVKQMVLFRALAGADYGSLPQFHTAIESTRDDVLRSAKPIADLRRLNPSADAKITEWLSSHGHTDLSALFQGLKARHEDMAVMIDAKTGAVIGVAPFKPWP